MKRNRVFAIVMAVVLAATGFWFYQRAEAKPAEYRFGTVERGDVQLTVSSTGKLSAVSTVSVGTQVSGQIAGIFVDFNDTVKKGQLLARIDPTLAEQAVADAQASLESRRAAYAQAQSDFERNRSMLEAGLVSRAVYETSQSQFAVTRANVKAAEVALDKARRNLQFTEIVAPIDGIVVERNVDAGQTVAASLSAPQLFLIANDLSQMQILASVDESDIAQIKEDMPVKFTVQAMPRETFTGRVRQVRLQSTIQENVVNYTVVVEVPNREGKLLPGMTASVDFEAKSAENVLTVPNAALRFTPLAVESEASQTNARAGQTGPATNASPNRQRRQRPANAGRVWTIDNTGKLTPIRVTTGITNGSVTEIAGANIAEGTRVVVGVNQTTETASAAPLGGQSRQPQGPRGPGGF